MATITTYKLNGQEVTPFRDAVNVSVNAVFGEEVQADLSIDEVELADSAENLNAKTIKDNFLANPMEGIDFSFTVQNQNNFLDFNFYTDYTRLKFLASNAVSVGMIKDSSLNQFNDRAPGITMQLLKVKGLLGFNEYTPFPYVVENRKTELEKIQLIVQGFTVVRSITVEVRNIINIASDIPTLGGVAAGINLSFSVFAINQLFNQLVDIFFQIQKSFFPEIKYHAAIKPKTFIEKAVIDYMGYDAVEFGSFGNWERIINELTWCPSKNQEKGLPVTSIFVGDGILKPQNEGYNLFDCKEFLKEKFVLREAIIDNVYHLRPEQDPFWVSNNGYVLPSVLIESDALTSNGFFRPNFEDLYSSVIVEYQTDDSDLHTLDDLANEDDPNTTGKIISVKTVEPISVTNQRKVMLKGSKSVNISYAIAVRKTQFEELYEIFEESFLNMEDLKQSIEDRLAQFSSVLNTSNPLMETFVSSVLNRSGACKVENDFFSTPKMALIANNSNGLPRIPEDFVDLIGAKAINVNHQSYYSFIPGERNPSDQTETAAKYIYEDVEIPFGLDDYALVENNAYFTTDDGQLGKFISLNWRILEDRATCSFWIYNNWASNIEETLS